LGEKIYQQQFKFYGQLAQQMARGGREFKFLWGERVFLFITTQYQLWVPPRFLGGALSRLASHLRHILPIHETSHHFTLPTSRISLRVIDLNNAYILEKRICSFGKVTKNAQYFNMQYSVQFVG
jgi:hypothetical protein